MDDAEVFYYLPLDCVRILKNSVLFSVLNYRCEILSKTMVLLDHTKATTKVRRVSFHALSLNHFENLSCLTKCFVLD